MGKGYCQRVRRAVRANLVAAWASIVLIGGVRVGLLRGTRFGKGCEEAVAALFGDLPASADKRLFSVDAGIATMEQFAAATEPDALVGRLRKTPRCAGRPDREERASAAGRRCMGRCCTRGQSGQKAVPMKRRRSRSKGGR